MHADLRKMQAWEYLKRETVQLQRVPMEREVIDLASSLRDEMVVLHQEFEGDPAGATEAMFEQGGQMWTAPSDDTPMHVDPTPDDRGLTPQPNEAAAPATARLADDNVPSGGLPRPARSPTHLFADFNTSPVSSGGFSNLSPDDPDAMDLDSSSAGEDTE